MTQSSQVPLDKCAFDHLATRQAWRRARRRVGVSLVLWTVLWMVSFVAVGMYVDEAEDAAGLIGAACLFVYVVALCLYGKSLLRLRKLRKVLQAYPWEHRASVRRAPRVRESFGVFVQIKTGDSDDDWTQLMRARNPLRWKRRDAAMESGAWFAGDASFGGAIALPGGQGLILVHRCRMSVDELREVVRDRERMARARSVGIAHAPGLTRN